MTEKDKSFSSQGEQSCGSFTVLESANSQGKHGTSQHTVPDQVLVTSEANWNAATNESALSSKYYLTPSELRSIERRTTLGGAAGSLSQSEHTRNEGTIPSMLEEDKSNESQPLVATTTTRGINDGRDSIKEQKILSPLQDMKSLEIPEFSKTDSNPTHTVGHKTFFQSWNLHFGNFVSAHGNFLLWCLALLFLIGIYVMKDIQRLEAQLATSNRQNEASRVRIYELESQLTALTRETDAASASELIRRNVAAIQACEDRINQLQTQVMPIYQQINASRVQVDELRTKLGTLIRAANQPARNNARQGRGEGEVNVLFPWDLAIYFIGIYIMMRKKQAMIEELETASQARFLELEMQVAALKSSSESKKTQKNQTQASQKSIWSIFVKMLNG